EDLLVPDRRAVLEQSVGKADHNRAVTRRPDQIALARRGAKLDLAGELPTVGGRKARADKCDALHRRAPRASSRRMPWLPSLTTPSSATASMLAARTRTT